MPNSMTGYAISKHIDVSCEVVCEIKSVNHRFLEISTKPNDLSNKLDIFIRNTLQKKMERGAIDVRFKFSQPSIYSYSVNKKSLGNLKKILNDLSIGSTNDILLSDIKNIPGIFESKQENQIADSIFKKVFLDALNGLLKDRGNEGSKIQQVFDKKIKKIITSKKKLEKAIPALNKTRMSLLNSKVKKLSVNLDPEKLNQETALLILKHDVAEELERIAFHTESMQKELSSKHSKGKKIDFILQELFRETSTLSVKIDKPLLKELALNMKLAVEEMREQAQNLE
ncbi:DUF1732 domain-containing protein [Gammaproteobacteria bacterium]|nr:DUF1732 domain-containing protein [Gammaproteobacteria bacterium]